MVRFAGPLFAFLLLTALLAGCLTTTDGELDAGSEPAVHEGLSKIEHALSDLVREPLWVQSSIDGEPLKVDVYRPEGDGPFPVILILSPYWSFLADAKENDVPTWEVEYFAPRGYAVALGEMRGTRESHGCWDFGGRLDQQDGHDIVESLAGQSWSNGNVGMIGGSHVGMSQIAAAITDPPSLKAIVPIVAVSDWYRYLHKDGAPYVVNRATPPAYFAVHASPPMDDMVTPDWLLGRARTVCDDNVIHLSKSAELDGDKDAYWQERDLIAQSGNIRSAVYLVHGLQDENVKTDHFLDFWQALPETVDRKMWIGQFGHATPSYYEWREDVHRWFDHFLLEKENGVLDDPVVTVQDNLEVTRWEADWPGNAMRYDSWVLSGSDLEPESGAQGDTREDSQYLSIPGEDRNNDLFADETRIHFRSGTLDAPMHLAGAPMLQLEATLMAPQGRWIAVLYDEAPDGSREEITRAYMEARHRNGVEQGQDVPIGEVQDYNLSFFPRDHVVSEGHRIVLSFKGGDMGCAAPAMFGPQTCEGTGVVPHPHPVLHTVHHGPGSETRLLLPTLAETGPEREVQRLDSIRDDPPE